MHYLQLLVPIIAIAEAAALANYVNRGCSGNSRVCTNIRQTRCCANNGFIFQSTRFSYLADTSFGIICSGTANQPCQTSRASTHGGGCVQAGATIRLRGSWWFDCHNIARCRRSSGFLLDQSLAIDQASQLPDKLVLDGKVFEINGNVSAADTAQLNALADAETKYEKIPNELLRHEVTAEVAKAVLSVI